MSQKNLAKLRRLSAIELLTIACLVLSLCFIAQAQQDKKAPAKPTLTGRYDGTAKNKGEEVITVSLDLTDKDGALSGMINSSHGDFSIVGGSHEGDTVTIEFDTGGPTGILSLHLVDDRLVGTWTAGDDGGPLDVKKVAAPQGGSKDKS